MVTTDEIKKLAALARIELTEEEINKFSKDIGGILEYVDAVKKVANETDISADSSVRNVLRGDEVRESGEYTGAILKNAPNTRGDYIAVKKILEGKK